MMGCSKDFFFCSIWFDIKVFWNKKKEVADDDKMLNVIGITHGVVNQRKDKNNTWLHWKGSRKSSGSVLWKLYKDQSFFLNLQWKLKRVTFKVDP